MEKVKVVRIRWKNGIERLDVKPNETIGSLIDRMANKYGFLTKNLTLLQESTKTNIVRSAKLSQLKIENGELFRLDLPTDSTKKDIKINYPKATNLSEWSSNVISVDQVVQKQITIEQQQESYVKKILFPYTDFFQASQIILQMHFKTPRVFLLYGTVIEKTTSASVRVHAITFPTQTYKNNEFHINESQMKVSDSVAHQMGLQLVGLVVVSEFKDPPIISYHMSYLAKLQKKIGKHFIIISAHPDMGKCSLEGYQFSSQFLDLVESNFFVQSNDYSYLKSDKSAFLYTKLTNEFDVYYFLVNVAIVSRDSWFPRSWFPYQSLFPTIADFSDVMRRGYNIASPNYVRLLDFNLLMFLDAIFDQSLPVIIDCCIKKKKLPIEIETKIEEMIYESIPMFV